MFVQSFRTVSCRIFSVSDLMVHPLIEPFICTMQILERRLCWLRECVEKLNHHPPSHPRAPLVPHCCLMRRCNNCRVHGYVTESGKMRLSRKPLGHLKRDWPGRAHWKLKSNYAIDLPTSSAAGLPSAAPQTPLAT